MSNSLYYNKDGDIIQYIDPDFEESYCAKNINSFLTLFYPHDDDEKIVGFEIWNASAFCKTMSEKQDTKLNKEEQEQFDKNMKILKKGGWK